MGLLSKGRLLTTALKNNVFVARNFHLSLIFAGKMEPTKVEPSRGSLRLGS
jgi:hypothetical protein